MIAATAASDADPAPSTERAPERPAGYRPHLDGARALAVTAVILFHLGYAWIPGGFVGVDLFFVLSGYLITGLLLTEVSGSGTVRLGRFYARRVRRLLPASLAVLAAVAVATNRFLDPVDQQTIGHDITWSALYSANWRFVTGGVDYFQPGDVPSPLQHFWSLAVEEQFYLVWPVLLLGLVVLTTRKGKRDANPALLGIIVAIGVVCAWVSVVEAGTNLGYFGTPARAYQLLAGAALAVAARRWGDRLPTGPTARRAGTAVAAVGLGLLGWCAVDLAGDAVYPGPVGLLVTAASLAVLVGLDLAPPGPLARVLGARGPALIGRLSYSLYLWHWPVIVFAPILAERWSRPIVAERWFIGLVTVALAVASHVVIERPVRFGLVPKAPAPAVVAVGLTLSLVAAVATIPSLQPRDSFAERALEVVEDTAPAGACPYTRGQWGRAAGDEPCVYRRGGPVTLALVGDSHAQQWQPAIERIAERYDLTVIRLTRLGCPVNDILVQSLDDQGLPQVDDLCSDWRERMYQQLITQYDPDILYVETHNPDWTIVEDDGSTLDVGDDGYLEAWSEAWTSSVEWLTAGTGQVFLSTDLPQMSTRVPGCLAEHGRDTDECDTPLTDDPDRFDYNDAIRSYDGVGGLKVVDPTPIVCPDEVCPAMIDNRIVHRDDDHLSAGFARHAAGQLEDLLLAAGADFATPVGG